MNQQNDNSIPDLQPAGTVIDVLRLDIAQCVSAGPHGDEFVYCIGQDLDLNGFTSLQAVLDCVQALYGMDAFNGDGLNDADWTIDLSPPDHARLLVLVPCVWADGVLRPARYTEYTFQLARRTGVRGRYLSLRSQDLPEGLAPREDGGSEWHLGSPEDADLLRSRLAGLPTRPLRR